jgi:UDP-N-acetylmuramyl tripeptide synthase
MIAPEVYQRVTYAPAPARRIRVDRAAQVRSRAALAVGRGAGRLSQVLGRGSGTMIGGRTALRLAPGALAAVARGRTTALVTGTNGKSTVTALVAAAMGAGGPVACNSTGANMPDGIVTALDADRTSPMAALEVDEVYLDAVVTATRPRALVVLNAYREYTRGVSLASTLQHWRTVALRLNEDCPAIINVDDPLVCWAYEPAARRVGVAGGLSWHADAALCPACGAAHVWDDAGWHCPGCGRSRPTPEWRVSGGDEAGWTIEHPAGAATLQVTVPGRTGPVGGSFALAVAGTLGLDLADAAARVGAVSDVDGRYLPFDVDGRSARLLMLKNPAGWAEAIDLAVGSGSPIVLAVDPFGPKDTTTMWEAPFERLAGREVCVTGGRSPDALAILEAAGVPAVEAGDAVSAITSRDRGEVLVACNYPAFRRISKLLRTGAP